MTTAVAPAPSMAALAAPSISEAPRSFQNIAPSAAAATTTTGPTTTATAPTTTSHSSSTPDARRDRLSNGHSPASNEPSPSQGPASEGRGSPTSNRVTHAPKVIVKKEPASPEMATSRHRPRRLDLSKGANGQPAAGNGRPSAPLTSKESAGLAIQDLGLQCLSPGFHTQDPTMREQLQRSMNVREQQRQLIEARQKGKVNATTPPEHMGEPGSLGRPAKPLGTSRRKGPPPGLSIAAPSAAQFQDERVIQSAPLGQSFTGLNRNIHPATRHIVNQPTSLSNTSHIHHQPAVQTSNRLPPIADVFAGDSFANGPHSSRASHFPHSDSPHHPPARSPGFPPPPTSSSSQHQHPQPQQATYPPPSSSSHMQYPHTAHPSSRPREYRSAEEALSQITGGREDLLPRIVHYGGHQPPTPPSPMPTGKASGMPRDHLAVHPGGSVSGSGSGSSADAAAAAATSSANVNRSVSGRRRDRDEYERDLSPRHQQQQQQEQQRRRREAEAMWTDGRWERDSPETRQRKKERFISLCSEAWDLFHS